MQPLQTSITENLKHICMQTNFHCREKFFPKHVALFRAIQNTEKVWAVASGRVCQEIKIWHVPEAPKHGRLHDERNNEICTRDNLLKIDVRRAVAFTCHVPLSHVYYCGCIETDAVVEWKIPCLPDTIQRSFKNLLQWNVYLKNICEERKGSERSESAEI